MPCYRKHPRCFTHAICTGGECVNDLYPEVI